MPRRKLVAEILPGHWKVSRSGNTILKADSRGTVVWAAPSRARASQHAIPQRRQQVLLRYAIEGKPVPRKQFDILKSQAAAFQSSRRMTLAAATCSMLDKLRRRQRALFPVLLENMWRKYTGAALVDSRVKHADVAGLCAGRFVR